MRPELDRPGAAPSQDHAAEVRRLRAEIDSTRDELANYVSELDRRRHEALDIRLQGRKHPAVVIGIGVGMVAAAAGAVAMAVRSRSRGTLVRNARRALARLVPARPGATPRPMAGFLRKTAVPLGLAVARVLLARARSRASRPVEARAISASAAGAGSDRTG